MSSTKIAVCQVIDSINEDKGGMSQSVTSLAEHLARRNVTSHIFTIEYAEFGAPRSAPSAQIHSHPAGVLSRTAGSVNIAAGRNLDLLCANGVIDAVHSHGLWLYLNHCAARTSRRHSLPLIVSTRGMLEPWSLNQSRMRKRIAWALYEGRNVRHASALHATSIEELRSIRALGITSPIAVIPNGVTIPDMPAILPPDPYPGLCKHAVAAKRVLFLSRLHKKKGLDILIAAWRELRGTHPDWHLIIAGPDDGFAAPLNDLIAQHQLGDSVHVVGALTGAAKEAALRHAQLFILPSYSENFGNVIAEALSYAVPVIATTATPWSTLTETQCGWWVPPQHDDIRKALDEAMSQSALALNECGTRGRDLMAKRFSWESCAAEMEAVYRWVLHGGSVPACITMD